MKVNVRERARKDEAIQKVAFRQKERQKKQEKKF